MGFAQVWFFIIFGELNCSKVAAKETEEDFMWVFFFVFVFVFWFFELRVKGLVGVQRLVTNEC